MRRKEGTVVRAKLEGGRVKEGRKRWKPKKIISFRGKPEICVLKDSASRMERGEGSAG